MLLAAPTKIPDGLGVRIPDSHSGGPGSIPGQGAILYFSTSTFADGICEDLTQLNRIFG